jgi:glycosyltransferase involved in cell wall biosynthesis
MVTNVTFNGKFLGAKSTGVHRVASELIAASDKYFSNNVDPSLKFSIMLRDKVKVPSYSKIETLREIPAVRWMHRIAWEQFYLPLVCRKNVILNLCNIGPFAPRSSITMIHDAQVYSTPASYSRAFRIWYKTIMPLIGRRHKIILTVSEYSKKEIEQYGIAKGQKIRVIHNGCDHILRIKPDLDVVARLGLTQSNYVVALANVQKHKNIEVLLKAFGSPALQGRDLVLFGPATMSDFEQLGHRIPSNVKLAGRLTDEEVTGLMTCAGALAFPSLTEGFGLPPLEAMGLGCPTVVAPCGALPEVCGDAALYADPYSPDDWAEKLQRVLENAQLRQDLREKGLVQAAKFTWEKAARQMIEAIQSVSTNTLNAGG